MGDLDFWLTFWFYWVRPVLLSLFSAGLLATLGTIFVRKKLLGSRWFDVLGVEELNKRYKSALQLLVRRRERLTELVTRLVQEDIGDDNLATRVELKGMLMETYQELQAAGEELEKCQDSFDGILKLKERLEKVLPERTKVKA